MKFKMIDDVAEIVGNEDFSEFSSGDDAYYVDKTNYLKSILGKKTKVFLFTRPRRFGKSMAANMLVAYYDKTCDSKELFCGLNIADDESFERHINKYNVIHINMM